MAKRTCTFVFLILTICILADSALAAGSCADVFNPRSLSESPAFPQDPVTLRRIETEIKNSKVASDFFMTQLRAQSESIKANARGKIVELDFLCLGAGPQCAAASLVLGKTRHTSMVLEKSDTVARNFSEKDFFINTVELETLTMHDFPGGVGSLANHSSLKYAFSTQLASHIQAQQYASNVPVLLGTAMVSAKILKIGNEQIVEITTDAGIVIRTKNLILGTGLGEVGTKIRHDGYRAAYNHAYKLHTEKPDQLFPIMSTDSFLKALRAARASGRKLQIAKEVVIVGDGDGAKISMEGLSSLRLPEGFKITWVGNSMSTAEQYLARNDGERYIHMIVPFYERNQIKGVPGHAQTWEVLPGGQMRLTVADKKTGEQNVAEGQMIIDSTGYENTVPGILAEMGAQTKLVDVMGPLPEMNLASTVLGRQAVDKGGAKIPVFAIGAAAGPLGTEVELATAPNKNPIAMFNSVPRTSILVSKLAETQAYESKRGAREKRSRVLTADEIIREAKAKRARQINAPVTKIQTPPTAKTASAS